MNKRNMENNEEVSNKRRKHDLEKCTDNDLVDMLDNHPFLYRSLQTYKYLNNNKIKYTEDMKEWENEEIFRYIYNYVTKIIKKFFSKMNPPVWKDDEIYTNISDTLLEFSYWIPIFEKKMNANFGLLYLGFNEIIEEYLDKLNFKEKLKNVNKEYLINIMDDYQSLSFNIKIYEPEFNYPYNYIEKIQPISENAEIL